MPPSNTMRIQRVSTPGERPINPQSHKIPMATVSIYTQFNLFREEEAAIIEVGTQVRAIPIKLSASPGDELLRKRLESVVD